MNLKVLTYNIHKGFDWRNKNYFLKDIKDLVKMSQANIVLLQEVVGQNTRYQKKGFIDSQFEYIADSVWPHYSYAKNAVYDHGHHGNLVLSEFPIARWENINISTNSFERRGLLVCEIDLPGNKKIYILCIHLDLLHKGRQRQYAMIRQHLESLNLSEDVPLILAGDFNDWKMQAGEILEYELGMTEVHKHQHGAFAKTFPAALPLLSLDRIYVRNLDIVHSYVLHPSGKNHFSDHLPLFSEVKLNEI